MAEKAGGVLRGFKWLTPHLSKGRCPKGGGVSRGFKGVQNGSKWFKVVRGFNGNRCA